MNRVRASSAGILLRLWLGGCAGALAAGAAESAPPNPRHTGVPFTRTWLAEDYNASPATRGVIENPRTGFMYFSNAGGLLEFDGVRWRLFTLPGGGGVNGLAIDPAGEVRFNTDREIGRLAVDAQGDRQVVLRSPALPRGEPALTFGACVALADGIYYTARDRLVCFSYDANEPPRIWKFPQGELSAALWVMDGALHVRGPNSVFRFDGALFHEVTGLRTIAYLTRPDPAGGWQAVNRDGVRRWDDGYKSVGPTLPVLVSPLDGDIALNAAYLSDGRIAFGTTRSGIILADRYGRRLQKIDRSLGLLSDRVEGLCTDREGGLWATFRNGIMRLQVDSPYVRHGTGTRRIDGTPTALAVHRGDLYVGGGEGLWRRDRDGEFRAVDDVPQYVRSLTTYRDELYLTGIDFRRVQPDDRTELVGSTYHGLVPISTAPGFVVHGSTHGVVIDRVSAGTWTAAGRVEKITGPTIALAEFPAGVVWVAHDTNGLWRIDFRGGVRPDAPVKNYRAQEGVPVGLNQFNAALFAWDGSLGGLMAGKFVRYDANADRFVPETRIDGAPADGAGGATAWIIDPSVGADGSLWLLPRTSDPLITRVVPTEPHRWRAEIPPGPDLRHFFGTALRHDEATHTLWIAGNGLLLSRDLDWQPTAATRPPVAMIRRIEEAGGKLLWADGASPSGLRLAPTQNRLRVLYTSPVYAGDFMGRTHTRFRTRLEGLDDDWTKWSNETQRDFTNLPYRDFVFRLQVLDDQRRESPEARFAFSIAPPWWLTRGMFGAYALAGLAGMAGLVRWRTRTLQRRAKKLEAVVATRTEDLRQSNAELARLHAIERDEKLAARLDEEKARLEMLRYQLNPHFLYNTLASICGTARSNPDATRAMAQRLADFCRLTLTRADETETVREELRMLQAYLAIEKTRWRDSLQIEIEVADAALDGRLPTFLLLPLIENAIKHGGRTSPEVLRIRLVVQRQEGDALEIEVANTGTWDTVTPHPNSTGIGLENMRRRLTRHFGADYSFAIGPEGGWVVARLRLGADRRQVASVPATR